MSKRKLTNRVRLLDQAHRQVDLFRSEATVEVVGCLPAKLLLLYIVRELNDDELNHFIGKVEDKYQSLLDREYGVRPKNYVEEVFKID